MPVPVARQGPVLWYGLPLWALHLCPGPADPIWLGLTGSDHSSNILVCDRLKENLHRDPQP